jgi:hypothetical protein
MYNISKLSWEKITFESTQVYPVSQFLDPQNFKGKYESRKILVFERNSGFYNFLFIKIKINNCKHYYYVITTEKYEKFLDYVRFLK